MWELFFCLKLVQLDWNQQTRLVSNTLSKRPFWPNFPVFGHKEALWH